MKGLFLEGIGLELPPLPLVFDIVGTYEVVFLCHMALP